MEWWSVTVSKPIRWPGYGDISICLHWLMDDRIVNGEHASESGDPMPLARFTAPRLDYALQWLNHYRRTRPDDFQNFVLFINYNAYINGFAARAKALVCDPRRITLAWSSLVISA